MNFVQSFQKKNPCYHDANLRSVAGIILYAIWVEQGNAESLIKRWDSLSSSACPHAVVEKDRITQLIPWEYKGREEKDSRGASRIYLLLLLEKGRENEAVSLQEVYDNAAHLCAILCIKYSLDAGKSIACRGNSRNRNRFLQDVRKWQQRTDYHCLPPFNVTVAAPFVFIRTGPGEQYPVIAIARKDESYQIASRANGWGRLKDENGYVRLAYTKRNPTK